MSQPGIARVLVLYPAARDAERTLSPVAVSTHGAVATIDDRSIPCPALLVRPVSLRGALSFEDSRAALTWGLADIANPIERDPEGQPTEALAAWRELLFPGRRFEQYWADVDRAGRAPRHLDEYDLEMAGIIDEISWQPGEHRFRVHARDRSKLLEQVLDLPKFQGLAECYRCKLGARIDIDTNGLALGDDWTFSVWFRFGPGDLALAGQRIIDWGDTGKQRGLLVVLNAGGDGRIRLLGYGLSTAVLDTAPGVLAEDLLWHQLHVTRDATARTVTLSLDGAELVRHEDITGNIDFGLPAEPLSFAAGCSCWAIGWQLEGEAVPASTLKAKANQPPDVDAEELTAFWGSISPVDQGLISSSGANHGTAVGFTSADVVYSGEGWPDAAGTTKPLALGGPLRNVAGMTGDPGRWWIHLGLGPLANLENAWHRGLPLDLAEQVVEDLAAGLVQIRSLVGGEAGQWRFDFSGLEIGGQAESNAGAIVEHVGIAFAGMLPADFDSAALQAATPFDVAYLVPAGQAPTLGALIADLFRSNNAQAFFSRADKLTAARRALDESPTATLRQGPDIAWAEDLGEAIPTSAQTVLYARNWNPQSDGDLASTTDAEHRAFATREHRCADWYGSDEIAKDYPTAEPGQPLLTYLVHRRDAWAVGQERQEGLWGPRVHRVRLTLARRPVDTQGKVIADLGATLRVHASDLDTPPWGRIYKVVHLSSDEGLFGVVECLGVH